uniref:Putative methyltransferase n=1 Tax=Ixodes ricinus TaxID=34613 RepID=A0A090XEM2_IXORI
MSDVYRTKAHAGIYVKFRPTPPPDLIEQIVSFVKEKASLHLAVDVGCGSGQSSGVLAPHFSLVHAYDMSEAQITEAEANNRMTNLTFSVASAECLPRSRHARCSLSRQARVSCGSTGKTLHAEVGNGCSYRGGRPSPFVRRTPTPTPRGPKDPGQAKQTLLHDLLNTGCWG